MSSFHVIDQLMVPGDEPLISITGGCYLIFYGMLSRIKFPEGHPFKRQNFPRRNRTMALISDATVVVEAGEESGSRHQGWEAIRLGRLVYIMQNVAENDELSWAGPER